MNRLQTLGVSEDALRMLAIVTMCIDHFGVCVLGRWMFAGGPGEAGRFITAAYWIFRIIGRMAFPIFAYMLVKGFCYTRSVGKYALRLTVFAVISEVPFEYMVSGSLNFESTNVLWTLLIGLLVLAGLKACGEGLGGRLAAAFRPLASAVFLAAGMAAAFWFHTDYDYKGVLLIALFYLLRTSMPWQYIVPPVLFLSSFLLDVIFIPVDLEYALMQMTLELSCLVSFYLLYHCNGRRIRKGHSYFFYIFYPVHITLLYFFGILTG